MEHIKPHLNHRSPALYLCIADILFFGLTDPSKVPSSYFIGAFILLAATAFAVCRVICRLLRWYGLPIKRQGRAALTAGGICSVVIALQSVGQLTSRDIMVMLPLLVLAYFYFSYNQLAKKTV